MELAKAIFKVQLELQPALTDLDRPFAHLLLARRFLALPKGGHSI